MDKLGRNYVLEVAAGDGSTITIALPFTIEFDVTRNTLSSANVFQIRIYNLSLVNRTQLRFNVYEYATFRSIRLRAGYGNNLATICEGNITQAWSFREGVNFITQIESYDGGFAFANGNISMQFPSGSSQRNVIASMMKTLPETKLGAVGSYPGTLTRGNSYTGNTADILNQVTGGGFFIDNGKSYALGSNEYVAETGGALLIDAQSGLLGTPLLENNIVRFEMLFEPGLNVGRRIQLESVTEAAFNNTYKVTGVKHRGMISEAVCGSVITTGEFLRFKDLIPVTGNG